MNELVVLYENEPRASSKDLAKGFGVQHRAFVILMNKYQSQILDLGKLPNKTGFDDISNEIKKKKDKGLIVISNDDQTVKRGGDRREVVYFLNERQATLMGMLQRNSEQSVAFKVRLEKDYHKCKKTLAAIGKTQSTEEWQAARLEGKTKRVNETKAIMNFVEYAKEQGSKSPEEYYRAFSKMENTLMFIVAGKFKNLRDVLTTGQLMTIGVADRVIEKAIVDGMNLKLPYKDVFQLAKSRIQQLAAIHGQSEVVQLMLEADA